jgi:HPt (histidine-containing phosphotransfer) domain-containing protein
MSLPSFDWRQLQAASGGDTTLEMEILELFIQHTETQLRILSEAWDHRDLAILVQLAHQLRGSCSNIGALALNRVMTEIEHYAALGKEIDLERLMDALMPAFTQTVNEIHQYSGQTFQKG